MLGEWKSGKKDGKGQLNYPNGDAFNGDWKNGKKVLPVSSSGNPADSSMSGTNFNMSVSLDKEKVEAQESTNQDKEPNHKEEEPQVSPRVRATTLEERPTSLSTDIAEGRERNNSNSEVKIGPSSVSTTPNNSAVSSMNNDVTATPPASSFSSAALRSVAASLTSVRRNTSLSKAIEDIKRKNVNK